MALTKAAMVAVLLMQCCNVISRAARPLLDAGRYSGIMQILDKNNIGGCSGPGGGNNSDWQGPHPGGGCYLAAVVICFLSGLV